MFVALCLIGLQSAGAPPASQAADLPWITRWETVFEPGAGHAAQVCEHIDWIEPTLSELERDTGASPERVWGLVAQLHDLVVLDSPCGRELLAGNALSRMRAVLARDGLPRYAANLDQSLATELARRERLAEATQVLEQAITFYGPAGDGPEQVQDEVARLGLQACLGDVQRLSEDWGAALQTLSTTTARFDAMAAQPTDLFACIGASRGFGALVQLETALGRPERAWAASRSERLWAEKARTIDAELGRELSADAGYRRVDLLLSNGQYEQVLRELDGLNGRDGLQGALAQVGLTCQDQADPASAERALAGVPASELQTPRARAHLAFAEARLKRYAQDWAGMRGALELADKALREADDARDSLERERGTYAALLASHLLESGAPRAQLEQGALLLETSIEHTVATWRHIPPVPGGVGILQDAHRREVLGAYLDVCLQLGQIERGLSGLLALQACGSLARSMAVDAPSPEQLRAALLTTSTGGGAALILLPTLDRTHLLAITPEQVLHAQLPSGRALGRLATEVEFEALAGGTEHARRDELVAALFPAKVVQLLGQAEHIYVSGAELLAGIDLGKLPVPGLGEPHEPLADHLPFALAPSLPIAVWCAERAAPADVTARALRILAFPTSSPDAVARFGPLASFAPVLERDPGSIAGYTELLVGDTVTPTTLLEGASAEVVVQTLIAHGVFDAERDVPAGLSLSAEGGDGLVWAEDLRAAHPPALVVLGICGAGRAPNRLGEDGAEHLGGALLAAGARAVLLSNADLDVYALLDFLPEFHASLFAGKSPMEALRLARREARGGPTGGRTLDGLYVLGAAHEPVVGAPIVKVGQLGPWPWLLAVGGALLAAILIGCRSASRRGRRRSAGACHPRTGRSGECP